MRFLLALVLSLSSTVAYAACAGGSDDILKLTDWNASLEDDGAYRLEIDFENIGPRAFRMIEGSTYFTDALDRSIGAFKLPPDLTLAPGESGNQEWDRVFDISSETPRLPTAAHDDVTAKICVYAIVYADGSKERFD